MLRKILSTAVAAVVISTVSYADAPAPTVSAQRYEVRFMTEMIDHHAMAVMMADLCLERAVHPQLIQKCHEIRETQLDEIATMQEWLEDWYGIEHEPEMTPGGENQMEKLAALTGADFEIEFLKGMIRHHWIAVVKSRECQSQAYHTELIQMCEDIESAQSAEIELMGSWLESWYGVHNYHGSGS